jgi:hypothetical protein
LEDAEVMAKVDKKVAQVNDRVSDVISRFETYINEKSKKSPPAPPTQSHNVINTAGPLPLASDSQPSSQPIIIDLVAKKYKDMQDRMTAGMALLRANTAQSSLCHPPPTA